MTTALEGGEGSASRPGRSLPGKDPVPIVQEAGWAPGPVWTGAGNLDPPGFDPRTVQPVASRYTDYATLPTCFLKCIYKIWRITTEMILSHRVYERTPRHGAEISDTARRGAEVQEVQSAPPPYSGVCYNEQLLLIKSGYYNEHKCYNERRGILSGDVARACALRVGHFRFD